MTSSLRKHRRRFAAGILLAFLAVWVMPAQAHLADSAAAPVQSGCPDCPSPCPGPDCCGSMTACAAMLPAVAAPAPSLDKALPAPATSPVSYAMPPAGGGISLVSRLA